MLTGIKVTHMEADKGYNSCQTPSFIQEQMRS